MVIPLPQKRCSLYLIEISKPEDIKALNCYPNGLKLLT